MTDWNSLCHFAPWIGHEYGKSSRWGLKLLILGESHYVGKPEHNTPRLTRIVVQGQMDGTRRNRFFTKIVGTLTGDSPVSLQARQDFWNSVAYYNYVQEPIADGPRKRPLPEHWSGAHAPFLSVLSRLKPDRVLVFGFALWENLPAPMKTHTDDQILKPLYLYSTGSGHVAIAGRLAHPTWPGFRYAVWRPVAKRIIRGI